MNKLKEQIEIILQTFPPTRNSDVHLMTTLWQNYYSHFMRRGTTGELGVWLKDLHDLPRLDDISRIRRLIQNDVMRPLSARYLPTSWEVARQRRIKADEWRLAMSAVHTNN